MTTFKIGVRELVEFTLRSGDLNARLNSNNTAKQGAKIHRQIQKQRGKNYNAEYALSQQFNFSGNSLIVHGRADGIVFQKDPLIEEIKTSDVECQLLPDNIKTLYWGQVKVYAALLMLKKTGLKKINLKLTYVQTPDKLITTAKETINRSTAKHFLNDLLNEYQEWLKLRAKITNQTISSAHNLKFPFATYRPNQKHLAQVVYKTIYTHQQLLLEAPTGTGKTMSTLFPTIKAIGEQQLKHCFYLTAKQSTRQVAEAAISLMSNQGLKLKSITFTAKEQITFAEETDLAPEANPYLVGYYDRIKPALKDALIHHDQFTRKVIEQYAKKYQLDPFAFTMDLSEFCSVIICDYNYLFDPTVQLERFFKLTSSDKCYLIDEAHNLVSRSRDMYSTNFGSQSVKNIIKLITAHPRGKKRLLKGFQELATLFNDYQLALKQQKIPNTQISQSAELTQFNHQVKRITSQLHKWFTTHDENNDLNQHLLNLYFTAIKWLRISELYDETYRTRIVQTKTELVIRQFCIDPSPHLTQILKTAGSSVLFSATLTPMNYYRRTLDNDDKLLKYRIQSPFPPQNQLVITTPFIQTTYHQRTAAIPMIIKTIQAMLNGKRGHYLIFFPSFFYLQRVAEAFQNQNQNIDVIVQSRKMTAQQRKKFINKFKMARQDNLIGFAILGGIFSEGIDLKNDQLIGVGIVSVGLPGLNPENDLVADYFNQINHHGFDYAYKLPGWNHVVQAAGRLIRTMTDKGVIVLMDRRFSRSDYQKIFPINWQNRTNAFTPQQVRSLVTNFWNKKSPYPH